MREAHAGGNQQGRFGIRDVEEVRDLIVNRQEPRCACLADLNRFMIRSRRLVG